MLLNVKRLPCDAIGIVLVSLLLTLNIFHTLLSVSIVNFEHVYADWVAVFLNRDKRNFKLKRLHLQFLSYTSILNFGRGGRGLSVTLVLSTIVENTFQIMLLTTHLTFNCSK